MGHGMQWPHVMCMDRQEEEAALKRMQVESSEEESALAEPALRAHASDWPAQTLDLKGRRCRQNRCGIPFWWLGESAARFRDSYFSGGMGRCSPFFSPFFFFSIFIGF